MIERLLSFPGRLLRRVLGFFQRDPNRYLRRCRRLIHIGANEGQERRYYAGLGLEVLWVEALPEAYARLCGNLAGMKGQEAVQALLTDEDGKEHEFKVASNQGASSSIYEFKEHGQVWPDIKFVRTEKLLSKRLDTLMAEIGLPEGHFDVALLDVQGAELVVLKGFGRHLASLRYVQCEAADFEAYAGACSLDELSQFMTQNGFRLISQVPFDGKPGVGTYFDLVFEKHD